MQKESSSNIRIQDIQERINLIEAEIAQEEKAIESSEEKIVDASKLKGLTEKLSTCLTLDETSKALVAEVNSLFGSDDIVIIFYLFHSRTGELGISSSQRGQMSVNLKSKKGDEFDQWVVKTMQPLLVEDARNDYRFDIDKISKEPREDKRDVRSLISVPFVSGHKALGLLRIDSPKEYRFTMEDLRFLTTVGDLGSVAIENAQLYERVQQLAIRDSLTGLYLRRYFTEELSKEVVRHMRSNQPLSFLMFDLDHFKKYNDKFGHVAGDIVIRTLSTILTESFNGPGELIARYGGEEFCALLPDCTTKKAKEMAEMVRKKVQMQGIVLRRQETHITISVGVATFPDHARDKDELILKADQALYLAKQKGRNRVCVARDEDLKKADPVFEI